MSETELPYGNSRSLDPDLTMNNILVVYHYSQYPPRMAIVDHLYSFQRHSGARCFYLNLAAQRIPRYLLKIPFNLIIFHTIFLSTRWNMHTFENAVSMARVLRSSSAVKIALPQDEFFCQEAVCRFINEFDIQHVFSVSQPSEWPKIYRTVDFDKVKFHQVLTGYLEDSTLERINRMGKSIVGRSLDIGYRAWRAEPWLGRHGFLKTQLAEQFTKSAHNRRLSTDISTQEGDTFTGDEWYKFLLRCKYTIGVEGGASLLDWDGNVREKTQNYLAQHPDASFEEVEAACFPGLDSSLSLFAISPRHLEACATKTCQVLIEGEYNGVLTEGKHYIEIKRDFSNLEHVLDLIEDDSLRKKIVEKAYRDVVQSDRWSYRSFVRFVLKKSENRVLSREACSTEMLGEWLVWHWIQLTDILSWQKVRLHLTITKVVQMLVTLLPEKLKVFLRRWKRRGTSIA